MPAWVGLYSCVTPLLRVILILYHFRSLLRQASNIVTRSFGPTLSVVVKLGVQHTYDGAGVRHIVSGSGSSPSVLMVVIDPSVHKPSSIPVAWNVAG